MIQDPGTTFTGSFGGATVTVTTGGDNGPASMSFNYGSWSASRSTDGSWSIGLGPMSVAYGADSRATTFGSGPVSVEISEDGSYVATGSVPGMRYTTRGSRVGEVDSTELRIGWDQANVSVETYVDANGNQRFRERIHIDLPGYRFDGEIDGSRTNAEDLARSSTGIVVNWITDGAVNDLMNRSRKIDEAEQKAVSPDIGTEPDPLVKTVRYVDPLVLDLDGNGFDITPLSHNVLFDSNGDRVKTGTAWFGPGDGILVLDRNSNGQVDSGLGKVCKCR